LIKRALALWWDELIVFTFFNVVWLALQIPIITGPPATAAMYAIARRVVDNELVDPLDGWRALRRMFVPAWKWGTVNLFFAILIVANFWGYRQAEGQIWMILRLLWSAIALVWFAMNLFYWPFWLAQSDRRMVNTLRNSLVLMLKVPGFALTLTVISALLIAVSVLITLPLAIGLMAWLALIGVLAVDEALKGEEK
jgi:uncharacterized membrane protein YesL